MNGFIPRTALSLVVCLSSLAGCAYYREIVDPCWMERYNFQARSSVNEANNAQAYNGHVLDQTVWNYDFERDPKTGAPTDVLNPAGVEHLKYISRRRPVADCRIYLATAQDFPGVAELPPERQIETRNDLNTRRIMSIQRYLIAQTNGHSGFTVEVHDPAEVGLAAMGIVGSLPPGQPLQVLGAFQKLQINYQGLMPRNILSGAASGTSGGAGGAGGAGGGGAVSGPR